MNIEKINEQISRLEAKKAEYDEHMDKRISDMKKEKEMMISAQMQQIFRKHKIEPEELIRLRYANKEQMRSVMNYINSEIKEPAKPESKKTPEDTKPKEEKKNNAKENNA